MLIQEPKRRHVTVRSVLVFAIVGLATPVWPCSVLAPLPTADSLIRDAEVIVRVRAEGLSPTPGVNPEAFAGGSRTQVRFAILELLKGTLPSETIEFNGALRDRDNRNRGAVPYQHVRPASGGCFAMTYRAGAEYLLFLRRGEQHPSYAQPNELTPYWSALSPTNEQLFGGSSDPWFMWVSNELGKR